MKKSTRPGQKSVRGGVLQIRTSRTDAAVERVILSRLKEEARWKRAFVRRLLKKSVAKTGDWAPFADPCPTCGR